MAVSAYLNIDGIKGESTADKFAGQIECQSFSFNESMNVASGLGGGGGVGKPTFGPLAFTKALDTASPQILVALASGKHFPTATLSLVNAASRLVYATIALKQVFIWAQDFTFADGMTQEAVKLSYLSLQISVASQKPDGTLNTPVQGGWDLVQNKPL